MGGPSVYDMRSVELYSGTWQRLEQLQEKTTHGLGPQQMLDTLCLEARDAVSLHYYYIDDFAWRKYFKPTQATVIHIHDTTPPVKTISAG